MKNPKINIELDIFDKTVEIIGALCILILIGLPIYYFNELPEVIPRHFGADGRPDGFSSKSVIWIMPILGTLMYLGISRLNKYPEIFNYPQKITEENAERLYRTATKMMRVLNTIIASAFMYIIYSTIQTAIGNQNGLGTFFLPLFLIVIFGIIGYYVVKSMKR